MATYTDNYQLTKPTYAEQADIGVINSNMNKIDEIMHASQVSLADAYDQTATYNTGDVVMYEFLMYKCKEDNVTGNWDATKWERTTAAETGGGEVDFDLYGEASGNPASFADGAAAGLVECIADIEATQDLHGYDKPWAGGAGKNKLPLIISDIKTLNNGGTWNGNIYTINGMTFEIIADDNNILGIKANGTPSAHSFFGISGTYDANNYIFNGCPSGGANNTYRCDLRENVGGASIVSGIDTGSGFSFTLSESKTGVYNIRIESGYTANNLMFYPMIRLSTEPSGYEPYSNICPITPHTEVNITVSATQGGSGEDTQIALGRNVYGGTLNVKTGLLTVTHAFVTIDGNEAGVTWTDIGNNMRSSILNIENLKSAPKATGANAEAISNYLEKVIKNYSADVTGFYFYDESNIYVKLPKSVLPSADTSGCTQYLQSHNLSICYKLLTPQTVQLTPQEVNSLLGQNNISADTGDIDIVYVKESARIIPNPSGKSDAFLSSIELSGEKFEIIKELPTFPTSDGDYKLKLSVSSGVPTLSWVSDT